MRGKGRACGVFHFSIVGLWLVAGTGVLPWADLWAQSPSSDPLINEVYPRPRHAEKHWIELTVPPSWSGEDRVALVSGSQGQLDFTRPFDVQAGKLALVYLDRDNNDVVLLSSEGPAESLVLRGPRSLARSWNEHRGWIALVKAQRNQDNWLVPENVIDVVAWGGPIPPEDAGRLLPSAGSDRPQRLRLSARTFIRAKANFGVYDPTNVIAEGSAFGRFNTHGASPGKVWAVTIDPLDCNSEAGGGCSVTPGKVNLLPRVSAFSLADGSVVQCGENSVAWQPALPHVRYEISLGETRNGKFVQLPSKVVDEPRVTLNVNVARLEGSLSLRVRALGEGNLMGPWSRPIRYSCLSAECGRAAKSKIIRGISYRRQRKDSRLLCVAQLGGQACDYERWNRPHDGGMSSPASSNCGSAPSQSPMNDHGSNFCGEASISMVVSAYNNKCLSQDRIALALFGGIDGGHGAGMIYCPPKCFASPPPDECWTCANSRPGGDVTATLEWAFPLDFGLSFRLLFDPVCPGFSHSPLTFAQVKGCIDHGRPLITRMATKHEEHLRVLAGYCEDPSFGNLVLIYDPAAGKQWQPYSCWSRTGWGTWAALPTLAEKWPSSVAFAQFLNVVRSDEKTMWLDSDSDGIVDFDEDPGTRGVLTNTCTCTDTNGDGSLDLGEIWACWDSP